MRRWGVGAVAFVVALAACGSFGSSPTDSTSDAGDAGGAADAAPDADDGGARVNDIHCEDVVCKLPAQVCCLIFNGGAKDSCVMRPSQPTLECPGIGGTTRLAECENSSQCPAGNVCCVLPDATMTPFGLSCVAAGSCRPPAAETCVPSVGACDGGTCGQLFGSSSYFVCK
jgi:hypothetical protein